ncbi:Anhydro-N-acetylmuramic acid kinase [hydrothermal vent metagenome]|uniref:Anhydro-N-acetylmuramic acid kinase n=1 Tax=hydrothermal vent metagenome TaxID=652676 RepID=A0A1W1BEI8_9ZZZZ
MSGTSLDGIDIALCQIDVNGCELEASLSIPFDKVLKEKILAVINGTTTLKEIGEIDVHLALEFAKAVNLLLKQEDLNAKDIVAIGSHGQTLWHEPNTKYPFSMQLGNPSVLAEETSIVVVADFRSKDIASGGQGAPFAPAFHRELFGHMDRCAVVNIGGMANISILSSPLIGYDSGCGNVLMDMWITECRGEAYDRGGVWAKSGTINEALLNDLLSDSYFELNYPKSTGREYFNKGFLRKYLEPFDRIAEEDIQATLLALTAQTIADEIKKFSIKRLLVCGGGAKNGYLMRELQSRLSKVEVETTDSYGVSSDDMEAMIFAWFAYKRLRNENIDLKTVTGAKQNKILGGIYASN